MASMNDCKTIRPLLSEYSDNALDNDAAWKVRLHLGSCAVCSQVASELSATTRLLQSLPQRELSAGFEEALARRLADISLRPRPASPWTQLQAWFGERPVVLRPALASAAALAAVLPVALLMSRPPIAARNAVANTPAGTAASAAAANDAMKDVWDDHVSYSSSEPLGDRSGLLMTVSSTEPIH